MNAVCCNYRGIIVVCLTTAVALLLIDTMLKCSEGWVSQTRWVKSSKRVIDDKGMHVIQKSVTIPRVKAHVPYHKVKGAS